MNATQHTHLLQEIASRKYDPIPWWKMYLSLQMQERDLEAWLTSEEWAGVMHGYNPQTGRCTRTNLHILVPPLHYFRQDPRDLSDDVMAGGVVVQKTGGAGKLVYLGRVLVETIEVFPTYTVVHATGVGEGMLLPTGAKHPLAPNRGWL